jgi:hypothetical protein
MTKVTRILGLPLTLLLGLFWPLMVLGLLASSYLAPDFDYYIHKFGKLVGAGIQAAALATFGVSAVYIVTGIAAYVARGLRRKKTKDETAYAKSLICRGIFGVVMIWFVYFVLQLMLNYFYLSVSGSKLPALSN